MNSRLLHLFAGLFLLATFVQCDDTPLSSTSEQKQTKETQPDFAQPNLSSPDDGSREPTSVELEWETMQESDSYQVQLSTSEDFSTILMDESVESTHFTAEELPSDSSIHWKVRSIAQGQNSPWSDTRTFSTDGEEGTTSATHDDEFVSASGGDFVLDGETYRFAGTNAYYLPNYEKTNTGVVENALDAFEEAGIKVVRIWGFYDGDPQFGNDITLQPEPGEYSEENLKHLDNLIAKGKERGIKFIIAFANYWHELGGMPQYNEWDNNPDGGMQHFMNDPDTQKWYKDYIDMLLNRENTATGVQYKDEPAVFAWEIMNEGRNPEGSDPQELADWYQEIAQYIKSIDSNHMVSTGEEGFDVGTPDEYSSEEYTNKYTLRAQEGTSYLANTSIPEIDYGTAHWYPTRWIGDSPEDIMTSQRVFMDDHAKIAEDLGKPFVIGEYGYEGDGNATQLEIYEDLWKHNEDNQIDGSLIWQFAADQEKCWEYRGNICWPEGRQDADLYNSFKDHIQSMESSR